VTQYVAQKNVTMTAAAANSAFQTATDNSVRSIAPFLRQSTQQVLNNYRAWVEAPQSNGKPCSPHQNNCATAAAPFTTDLKEANVLVGRRICGLTKLQKDTIAPLFTLFQTISQSCPSPETILPAQLPFIPQQCIEGAALYYPTWADTTVMDNSVWISMKTCCSDGNHVDINPTTQWFTSGININTCNSQCNCGSVAAVEAAAVLV